MSLFTALAALLARTALIGGLAFAWSQRSAVAERWRVYRVALAEGQLRSEIQATLLIITFDAMAVIAVRQLGIIHYADSPGVVGALLTFALIFIWMELWFYATHRLLHLPQLYWIHRHHHRSRVTDPLTALSFSILDHGILLAGAVGFLVVLSQFYPITPGGVLLSAFINYLINVVGHSNVEFVPEVITNSKAGQLLVTPSYHSMHHARMHGNYGLFTTVCDRVFGTAHADSRQVYEHARAGKPLTSFTARLQHPAAEMPGEIAAPVE